MMETRLRFTKTHASEKLLSNDMPFIEKFRHGTTVLEYYKPIGVDLQEPHIRDKLYFVVSGSGYFVNGSSRHKFESGKYYLCLLTQSTALKHLPQTLQLG